MDTRVFGDRLRRERQRMGWTQQYAAREALGVSNAALSNYEAGRHRPGIEFIERAAVVFGVSVDYLIGRTNQRMPHEPAVMDAELDAILREIYSKSPPSEVRYCLIMFAKYICHQLSLAEKDEPGEQPHGDPDLPRR